MAQAESNIRVPAGAIAHQILLVEDDPETARALKAVLEARKYHVTIAKDGGQAQAQFVMHKPDFVFLDVILPGESGFEICERMKHTDETVPVVMLTAIDLQEARVLADRVGADGYLTKPCDPEKLVQTIRDVAQKIWERRHTDQPKVEGRIRFTCRCGKRFRVKPIHRGKTLTCPECGEQIIVPRHD